MILVATLPARADGRVQCVLEAVPGPPKALPPFETGGGSASAAGKAGAPVSLLKPQAASKSTRARATSCCATPMASSRSTVCSPTTGSRACSAGLHRSKLDPTHKEQTMSAVFPKPTAPAPAAPAREESRPFRACDEAPWCPAAHLEPASLPSGSRRGAGGLYSRRPPRRPRVDRDLRHRAGRAQRPHLIALVLCVFKEGTGRQRGERHRELKGGGA
jgi:hypothetical protein